MHDSRTAPPVFMSFLMNLPWYVNLLLAEAVFVIFKWIFPAMLSSDAHLKPTVITLSSLAWFFSLLFLLIGAITFSVQKKHRLAHSHFSAKHDAANAALRSRKPPAGKPASASECRDSVVALLAEGLAFPSKLPTVSQVVVAPSFDQAGIFSAWQVPGSGHRLAQSRGRSVAVAPVAHAASGHSRHNRANDCYPFP